MKIYKPGLFYTLLKPGLYLHNQGDKQNTTTLLSIYILLILTYTVGIFQAPVQVVKPLTVGLPFLIIGLTVTRNLNYKAGGLILIGVLYLSSSLIVFMYDTDGVFSYLSFAWVLTTVFIATLFLDTKHVIVLTIVENLYLVITYKFCTYITLFEISSWYFFNLFFCLVNIAVSIIIDYYRREIEHQNRDLEHKVQMRTTLIKHNLDEKNILVRELYHRTNNNIQLISSLLHFQLEPVADTNEVRESLLKVYSQLNAMSLVHNRLYSSGDLRFISLRHYFRDIYEHVLDVLKVTEGSFVLKMDVEDHRIPLELSISLGLIINEILINIYLNNKSGNNSCVLRLSAELDENDALGIIINNEQNCSGQNSLAFDKDNVGFNLVHLLVTSQLKGTFDFDDETSIMITVPFESFDFDDRQHTHSDF